MNIIVLYYLLPVCREYNPFCITSRMITRRSVEIDNQSFIYIVNIYLFILCLYYLLYTIIFSGV